MEPHTPNTEVTTVHRAGLIAYITETVLFTAGLALVIIQMLKP
jgi:hypothetical protein